MKLLAVIVLVAALAGPLCDEETPAPGAGGPRFEAGLVTGADPVKDVQAADRLGARLVRAEFAVEAPASALEATIAANAATGARVLPLAGFHGRLPTADEARNLATWAQAYGPGGTFWEGRDDGELAVREIEFGNETSFTYQYGDSVTDAGYADRARAYARLVRDADDAIDATGVEVGLLVQADDAGFEDSPWFGAMREAVPDIVKRAAGWTVHPYGPEWQQRLDRALDTTGRSHPIWITEWGLATDDGRCLEDNYGWDPCMTYADAAEALTTTMAEMRDRYGTHLKALIVYQSHDQAAPGLVPTREHYFGVLRNDLTDKGAYTRAVRRLLAG